MPFLETMFAGKALEEVSGLARGLLDRIWPKPMSEAEKADNETKKQLAQAEIEKMISTRDQQVMMNVKDVIVAEMQQGDNFTKRARPTIVYAGLAFIFLTEIFFPLASWVVLCFGKDLPVPPRLILPTDFWYIWGGVCSVWMVGRSLEKKGYTNEVIKQLTGSK